MKKGNISDAVIRRLPRYYRQLTDLRARGIVRTSSHALGQEMNITASQIRQDFSCFGEFGQQGYGYNVEELRAEIGHILGVDNDNHLIIVGVGNLGRAILNNFPFESAGFSVDASFDVSPAVIDTAINGVPVYSTDDLENYIKRLEKLEEITGSYPGVEKSYAIQAGREVRVMVKPEQVSEDDMVILARELAKRIESELEYPGQIKVHVLRETKVIEYAK